MLKRRSNSVARNYTEMTVFESVCAIGQTRIYKTAEVYFKMKNVERNLLEEEQELRGNVEELHFILTKLKGKIFSLQHGLNRKNRVMVEARKRLAVYETEYRESRTMAERAEERNSTRMTITNIIGGFVAIFVNPFGIKLLSNVVTVTTTDADRRQKSQAEAKIAKQRSFIQETKCQISSWKFKIQMNKMEYILYEEEIDTLKTKREECFAILREVQEAIRFFEEGIRLLFFFWFLSRRINGENTMLCIKC